MTISRCLQRQHYFTDKEIVAMVDFALPAEAASSPTHSCCIYLSSTRIPVSFGT